jgi:hypothetical protein
MVAEKQLGTRLCGRSSYCGVFVRGDEANALALSLSHVLGQLSDSNEDFSVVEAAARLSGLIELLGRSNSQAINHAVDQRVALC